MAVNVSTSNDSNCSSTVSSLRDLPFGGVPVVLLLNISVVLVLWVVFSKIMKKLWGKGHQENHGDTGMGQHSPFSPKPSSSYRLRRKNDLHRFVGLSFIRMREKEINVYGEDAAHYLLFQRHLIVLMLLMSVITLCVVLPVNMSGGLLGHDSKTFGRTTIANLQEGLRWLHTLVAVLYLGLTLAVLRNYTSKILPDVARHVLLVYSIPKDKVQEEAIRMHIEDKYHCRVKKVYLCDNVAEKKERKCESWCFSSCLRHCQRDYTGEFLNKAFVIMETESVATKILKDFNAVGRICGCGPDLSLTEWQIKRAVHPENVYWKNLSVKDCWWWLCFLGNILFFFMLLFLSTPSFIIDSMDMFNITSTFSYVISPTIQQFLPTVLVWIVSSVLPLIVYYFTLQEPHWTRSSENISMLYKLHIFLLTTVLILPSFDLTSLDVIRLLSNAYEGRIQFECIFLPDQGAFFVNYVITAALSGGAMELVCFPLMLLFNVSRAENTEKEKIKKQGYKFPFGAMYAWYLNVFTVIMAYSITCPVIVPIGFMHLLLKHLVDKHNLYYAEKPRYLDRHVHLGAVSKAMAAPIICLFWLYIFFSLQAGLRALTSLFTLLVLSITIFICIMHSCYGHFKYFCPCNSKEEDKRGISCEEELEEDKRANSCEEELVYISPQKAREKQTSGQSPRTTV